MKSPNSNFLKTDKESQDAFYKSFFKCSHSPWKVLIKIYKGSYWELLKSLLYYLIQHSPVLVMPISIANVINIATYPEKYSYKSLVINIIIIAILWIQNIASTYLCSKNRSIANRRAEFNLRSSLARKLQQLSVGFQKEMKSGKIQSKIMRDVECIEALVNALTVNVTCIIVNLATSIIVTLSRSWIVFVFFLISIPCSVSIMFIFRKKLIEENDDYRHEVENTSAQTMEMIEMIPIVKAHALEKTAMGKFTNQLKKMAVTAFSLDKTIALFGASSWVCFQLLQIACLLFTGTLAFKKVIPIGDITLYQTYFATIVGAINTLISLLPVITKGFESIKSVGDIMWTDDIEHNEGKIKLNSLNGEYQFNNVNFCYQDSPNKVLNGLNLQVKKGETIALVGESGSGKSTIINMVIGFYQPTGGELLIDGHNINDLDLRYYRSHIATVPQTSVLFSGTIRDNITFGMDTYTEEKLNDALRIANLQDVVANLPKGLDTNVGEHGDKLSGGQKQRIAIARAVIRNASVIIFDEATSALDTLSEKLIQDSIDKLAKNRTIFIVAHRLSTIKNSDKIAVIKNGVCVEYGTWDELLEKKGEFYRFRALQT